MRRTFCCILCDKLINTSDLRLDCVAAERFSCTFLSTLAIEPWLLNFSRLAMAYGVFQRLKHVSRLANGLDRPTLNRPALARNGSDLGGVYTANVFYNRLSRQLSPSFSYVLTELLGRTFILLRGILQWWTDRWLHLPWRHPRYAKPHSSNGW